MLRWEPYRRQVDYCAYWTDEEAEGGKGYMKPTHIWTNLTRRQWSCRGRTGDGQCGGRCSVGRRAMTGRWTHDQMQGIKNKEARCRVPLKLGQEWIQAAMRDQDMARMQHSGRWVEEVHQEKTTECRRTEVEAQSGQRSRRKGKAREWGRAGKK
jgi:hypothetical protein